jgi:hypothetical protein
MRYGGSTDDRGEFRLFGIEAGSYHLVAAFDEHEFGSSDRERYVPTYYPGVMAAADAQPVAITAGAELTGITLSLLRATTASISGVVRPADRQSPGLLTFVAASPIDESAARVDFAPAIAGPDGAFTIGGLLPGSYAIEARSVPGSEVGRTEVKVDSKDVAGVMLPLSKGNAARGRIRFDAEAPPADVQPSQMSVFAVAVDRQGASWSMDGDPSRPAVREDWSFEIPNLLGRRLIRAGAAAARWRLKSVHLNGRDITDTAVDFRNGDVDGIEIVLTNRMTTVAGGVTDDRGATVIDATVVLFAPDREKWGPPTRHIMSARPNQQGRFTVEGLPVGRYLAIAVDYLEPGDEMNPDLLEQWRAAATSVMLAEGESRTLNLRLSTF